MRIAILGLGVMGGSLARALARLVPSPTVGGWSPDPEERAHAVRAGVVERDVATWEQAVDDADLVVLATPLEAACALLAPVAARAPDATLTDVAGLKAPLEQAARAAGCAERWVGAHPMAGSEAHGFAASRADLYEGATVWVVPGDARGADLERVRRLWTALGALPAVTTADEHDRLMARVSHLPQLTANALAEVLAAAGIDAASLGPGGRDMTRLAASDPVMWRGVLAHAPPELRDGLRALALALERFASQLETPDPEALARRMESTRAWKREGR